MYTDANEMMMNAPELEQTEEQTTTNASGSVPDQETVVTPANDASSNPVEAPEATPTDARSRWLASAASFATIPRTRSGNTPLIAAGRQWKPAGAAKPCCTQCMATCRKSTIGCSAS